MCCSRAPAATARDTPTSSDSLACRTAGSMAMWVRTTSVLAARPTRLGRETPVFVSQGSTISRGRASSARQGPSGMESSAPEILSADGTHTGIPTSTSASATKVSLISRAIVVPAHPEPSFPMGSVCPSAIHARTMLLGSTELANVIQVSSTSRVIVAPAQSELHTRMGSVFPSVLPAR